MNAELTVLVWATTIPPSGVTASDGDRAGLPSTPSAVGSSRRRTRSVQRLSAEKVTPPSVDTAPKMATSSGLPLRPGVGSSRLSSHATATVSPCTATVGSTDAGMCSSSRGGTAYCVMPPLHGCANDSRVADDPPSSRWWWIAHVPSSTCACQTTWSTESPAASTGRAALPAAIASAGPKDTPPSVERRTTTSPPNRRGSCTSKATVTVSSRTTTEGDRPSPSGTAGDQVIPPSSERWWVTTLARSPVRCCWTRCTTSPWRARSAKPPQSASVSDTRGVPSARAGVRAAEVGADSHTGVEFMTKVST